MFGPAVHAVFTARLLPAPAGQKVVVVRCPLLAMTPGFPSPSSWQRMTCFVLTICRQHARGWQLSESLAAAQTLASCLAHDARKIPITTSRRHFILQINWEESTHPSWSRQGLPQELPSLR